MASLCSLGQTLQKAERRFLQAAGFAVKNTFIDEVLCCSHDEQPSSLRRATTLPLPKQEGLLDAEDDDACVAMPAGTAIDVESDTSTHASAADSDSDGDLVVEEQEEELALPDLIRQQCSFLRIMAVTLVPMDEAKSTKLPVRGVSQCLRVCVQGLPGQKRMKWQNPLAWAVALSLQRGGVQAFVKRSKLYVQLSPSCKEHEQGNVVLVDLCAPRGCELPDGHA